MAEKRMSLLGGLIYEGMEETIKTFQQLTKDEQVKTINKTAEDMRSKLAQIQTTTEQIKSAHIRELEDVVKQALKDPLGSFVHLLFLPVELIFRASELVWGSLYGWLLNMFYPKGPVTAEEARMNAIEFFTITGDINVLATIFDII